ncbi:MAG: SirB2 family protein [Conchiformibius sp.]|nr:SirB2 family protein [Conchiformibius sp.]
MEAFYLPTKHSHLLFIALSIILFNLRFWLRTAKPARPLPKVLNILPHINDTLLLCSGMLLAAIAKFSLSGWLGLKLLLVVAYIGCGFVCMKRPPRHAASYAAYAVCMLLIAAVIYLARSKPF